MRSLLLAAAVAIAVTAYWCITGLRRNIAAAKASGLPYVISPCSPWFLPWQITHKLWIPILHMLPEPWWEPWLPPITPDFSWLYHHDHFARHGDSFLLVSPGAIYMFVAEAEAIHQITMRRDHFPKHTEIYEILSQFGENVLTSEGAVWRMHRRITAASFNERNAALVFRESIRQSLGLLRFWGDKRGRSSTLDSAEHDTMRLALNIIGYVGFGLRLPWPNEKISEDLDPMSAKYGSVEPPQGYHFSFVDAMAILLENVLTLLLVPKWLLWLIPHKPLREAVLSHKDYNKFINELMDLKTQETKDGERAVEGMDFMGQLVRSSLAVDADGTPKAKKSSVLSRNEIKGNAFVMLVAGHETTANAIHFTLLHLASNAASQRRLHRELDELVGDKDPEEWDYDELLNPLMASMVGACMNETLRLLPPVIEMPKITTPDQDQPLVLNGKKYMVPRGTVVSLCAASVHVNPRYWPTKPSRYDPDKSDIFDYVPERWVPSGGDGKEGASSDEEDEEVDGADKEDYGGYQGRDTSAKLFRPESGAYIPFSYGARACLGRRIAQVEVIAALAVLLREYSVELAVDEWASDEEVARMDREQMAEVYDKARVKRDEVIRGARSLLTLKLRGQAVPLRIVKRGEERFVNWMQSDG